VHFVVVVVVVVVDVLVVVQVIVVESSLSRSSSSTSALSSSPWSSVHPTLKSVVRAGRLLSQVWARGGAQGGRVGRQTCTHVIFAHERCSRSPLLDLLVQSMSLIVDVVQVIVVGVVVVTLRGDQRRVS
jgi:hypothetical protein